VADAGSAEDAGAAAEDAGGDASSPVDVDGGPSPDEDAGAGLGCTPNHDGIITAAEMPVAFDVAARYVAAGDADNPVAVDLEGVEASDGVTEWAFDGALAGDRQISVVVSAPGEHWFGDDFPDAEYVAPVDAAGTFYGAFRRVEGALQMLGVASAAEDDTVIAYDPPLDVLRPSLEVGDSYTVSVDAAGTFEGNPFYTSTDTYTVSVDARGRAITPAGTFDVLRVRTEQEVSAPIVVWPFAVVVSSIRYAFITECLGAVVQVTSLEDEETALFSEAAEVRRLGLMP
jgi:hypothetical protein